MADFHVELRSNAAPFFSDTDVVYVTAETPLAALQQARANYKHPAGLFAAGVKDSKGKLVARYLCPRAHTQSAAQSTGLCEWKGEDYYVSGVRQARMPELVEELR